MDLVSVLRFIALTPLFLLGMMFFVRGMIKKTLWLPEIAMSAMIGAALAAIIHD